MLILFCYGNSCEHLSTTLWPFQTLDYRCTHVSYYFFKHFDRYNEINVLYNARLVIFLLENALDVLLLNLILSALYILYREPRQTDDNMWVKNKLLIFARKLIIVCVFHYSI